MKTILTIALLFSNVLLFAQDRYYPLDGNAIETLNGLNGNLGTGSHAPTPTTDRFNNPNGALYFDGNDTLGLPITGMGTNEFSVAAWIFYPANTTTLRYWFCYGTWGTTDQAGGLGSCVFGNGLYFAGYRDSTQNYYELFTQGQPPINQWYHVCGVYSLNYTKYYVNGLLVDSSASNNIVPAYGTNPKAFIGSRSDTIGGWIGKIDDLHYFDHALTPAQVAALVASESDIVTGNCFIDWNGNGIQDAGEPNANGVYVISNSASRSFANQTNSSGFFQTLVDTGNIQTYVAPLSHYSITPAIYSSSHSVFGATDTVNFALQPTGSVTDLGVVLIPVSSAVPGFVSRYDLVCTNYGTDTASGMVRLILDHRTFYSSSTPNVDSTAGTDTLFWKIANLYPLQSVTISVHVQVAPPPIVNLGDTLYFCASIIDTSDINVENNNLCIQQIVIAPHDPNDKTVAEGNSMTLSQVMQGRYLTYVIRFQNTGTAAATNVSVTDTLSALLNSSSFQMIHSSSEYSLNIINGTILHWTFTNIMLPDSGQDQAGSQGYICYQIRPLTNLTVGDIIENTAYVYFDFNLPVVTNTTQTTVNETTESINTVFKNDFSVSPNPVLSNLIITGAQPDGTIRIFNSLGEKIKELVSQNGRIEIPVSDLSSGIYFVTYLNDNKFFSQKFVKE